MKSLSPATTLIKKSFQIFFARRNLPYFLQVYFFAFLLGASAFLLQYYQPEKVLKIPWLIPIAIPGILLYIALGVWVEAASYEAVRRVVDKEELVVKDTFAKVLKILPRFFLTDIVVSLLTLGGLILLVFPGIVLATWFAFSQFILIKRQVSVREALSESKKLVKGRFWLVLGRISVFFLFAASVQILFSLIPYNLGWIGVTIFGAVFLLPYYLLYQELAQHQVGAGFQSAGNI